MRLLAFAILCSLAPAIARADPELVDEELYRCKDGAANVAMTFKPEMEVRELVTWGMALTCKTFMLEPRTVPIGRKVTLIAPAKMTKAEAYQMFLAALATAGLTVVPKGKAFKVVDAPLARAQALPIFSRALPDDTDQIVRSVVRPTYAKPETLVKAFTALKSDAGDIQVIGSFVLVTDYGSHLRSMLTLKKLIDVAEGTDAIYTLPIVNADASKLVTEIETILGLTAAGPAGKGAETAPGNLAVPTKLLVDARTNTLVIAASEAAYQRVAALVDRLDISLDIEGGASIHVYRLSHAIAADLAAVLTQTITGQGAKAAPGPTAPPPAPSEVPRLDGEVRVIAEKASNSLIVMSSGRDYFAIRDIIRQLDEPRRQVYIEGVIAEVQLSNDLETGVSGHGFLPGSGDSVLLGGVQTGSSGVSSLDVESLAAATGLVTGVLSSGTTTLMGTTISSYGLLFTALATKTNSNVLAQPNMIAADNEETQYTIGTNIPYKRGLTYGGPRRHRAGRLDDGQHRPHGSRAQARYQAAHLQRRHRVPRDHPRGEGSRRYRRRPRPDLEHPQARDEGLGSRSADDRDRRDDLGEGLRGERADPHPRRHPRARPAVQALGEAEAEVEPRHPVDPVHPARRRGRGDHPVAPRARALRARAVVPIARWPRLRAEDRLSPQARSRRGDQPRAPDGRGRRGRAAIAARTGPGRDRRGPGPRGGVTTSA